MNNKSHYLKLWNDKVKSLKASVDYCKEALASSLENWERKEYQAVLEDRINELRVAEEMVQRIETNKI